MKSWDRRVVSIALCLLTLAGISRSLIYLVAQESVDLSIFRSLAVSPLPRVFDRPHYFMNRKAAYIYEDGTTEEFSESRLHDYFAGFPWHQRITSRHMFLYGYRRNPTLFDLFAKAVYCKSTPLVDSSRKPVRIRFEWVPTVTQTETQTLEREVLCP